MPSPDLLVVCLTAFVAVFALLGVLALVMRGLLTLFPAPAPSTSSDHAVLAAVSAAAAAAYPGMRITKIEEGS